MENIGKRYFLVVSYCVILLVLLFCVNTPVLLIHSANAFTRHLIIEEEVFETAMILALFGISSLILIHFTNRIKVCRQAANQADQENFKLASQLSEAFKYIGTVNAEIMEIESALCGFAFYPQSKKDIRELIDRLASRAMAIANTCWLVVRSIDKHSGRTVNEHAVKHPGVQIPSVTLGNRPLLDGRRCNGLQIIGSRHQNIDLLTVFILPESNIPAEKDILLTAILGKIEMLFILNNAGRIKPIHNAKSCNKEPANDYHR